MIRFDKKWFNPSYFILNDIFKDPTIRFVFMYGGKRSSKTVSICQKLSIEAIVNNRRTIALRKESTTIDNTLKESFNLAIDSTRLGNGFKKLDREYRSLVNDSKIILKGLDDPEKAKGVESFHYVYLDELNHFEESEFRMFNLSLSGMPFQKIIASWNPVDENSWVKVNLIDTFEWLETDYKLPCEHSFVRKSKCGRAILIKTTYEDNYWINGSPDGSFGFRDDAIIAEYNDLKSRNYNEYRINVLGEWGKVTYGGEILKKWKSERDIIDCPYTPGLAIYLSFDENVNPYFPCGIFQVLDDQKSIRMISCITAKNPNNTVRGICNEIKFKLKQWQHAGRVYITGDATSQKEDVKQEKGHDLFALIISELREFSPIRRVMTSNPSVVTSFEFFNSVLDYNAEGIDFKIDKSCKVAISDFENTKEDKNGKIDKTTVKDKITGISYQPYGHILDLTRYMLCSTFQSEYAKFQRGGVVHDITMGRAQSKNSW